MTSTLDHPADGADADDLARNDLLDSVNAFAARHLAPDRKSVV